MESQPLTDDRIHNPTALRRPDAFEHLMRARLSRRDVLGGLGLGIGAGLTKGWRAPTDATGTLARATSFVFDEIPFVITRSDMWPKGYRAQILLVHGDRLFADAPEYRPDSRDAHAQERQFGTNNDFIAYMPLPLGSSDSRHGLLCVNHEYDNANLLWPGFGAGYASYRTSSRKVTRAQIDVEMAAHGHSVVEIRRGEDGTWSAVQDSEFNRRITAKTPMELRGPAAGHERMKTSADPKGRTVLGTFNNCAGGTTPWGTVLFAEENFHKYFWGSTADLEHPDRYQRYGVAEDPEYGWGRPADDGGDSASAGYRRFDVQAEPNECHRFGWMVEYDPYDPHCVPVKRTALGRFKHEGADVVVDRSGHVVVYMGDDERFEYLYRFVSKGKVGADRIANSALLDEGTLSVARLLESGILIWLPLVHGEGPLDEAHGFHDQGDVLIDARRAGDLLSATPMDRPEEVQADPGSGRVYAMLTNNSLRSESTVNPANPRPKNLSGHVLELVPPGLDGRRDHTADEYRWNIAVLCGEDVLRAKEPRANLPGDALAAQMRCPDNCAFDSQARMWIATDTNPAVPRGPGEPIPPDGLWAIAVDEHGNRTAKFFYGCPVGAELCGPCFTPDGETLFVSVQHPGEGSSFEKPSTHWPAERQSDDRNATSAIVPGAAAGPPPRSAVVAITKIRPPGRAGDFDPRVGN